MLLWLIHGADRVVQERRAGLLDVIAQNLRNRLAFGKANQPLRARLESREVRHVQPARVETIACEQHSRLPIVKRNAQVAVAWDGDDVDNSPAKIDVSNIVRPMRD